MNVDDAVRLAGNAGNDAVDRVKSNGEGALGGGRRREYVGGKGDGGALPKEGDAVVLTVAVTGTACTSVTLSAVKQMV